MRARELIGPALAGAVAGLVITILGMVAYDCYRCWSRGGTWDPRCLYNFKNYVTVYERAHVTCRYEPDFPADIGAAP